MRKRLLLKCVIGLLLLLMLATLTLVGSTSITQAQPPQGTVQIIVKFKASDNSTAVDAAIRASGGKHLRNLRQLRTRVISVPADAAENVLAALAQDPSVERAATAVKFHQAGTPDDPGYTQQWALPKIAWDQVYGTTPITGSAIIAVLDTGVDAGHPDLASRMGSGQSFVNGDANSDPNGHGTTLAGIAAANVNNAMGVAGVAYSGVTVSSVQVLQPDGTGLDSDVIAGVVWAVDNGAKVILMGFSSADYSAALEDALQYAWSQGAVLVAATGNDSSSAPSYPAGMENVLGVASTDQDDNVAANSNTGSACVAAPGLDIYTTTSGGNYGAVSGTSAAAAETAGLAALLVASGQSNYYIYDQVRGAIDPITGQSFGRINVATAMGEAVTPPPSPVPEPPPPPDPNPPVYAPAAARTASVSGNWSSTATWGGAAPPVAGDNVTINSGVIVTVDTAAACASIVINIPTANNGITISGTNSLTVSGAITMTAPTANFNSTIAVGTGTLSAGSIAIPGGNAASRYCLVSVSTGTINVTGAITFTGTAAQARLTFTGAGTLNIGGNLGAGGTFAASTGTVNYNAAGAQTVGGYTYNNLTLSGSGAKTTTGVTVNGILSMEGAATAPAAPTYGGSATLQYNTATDCTAGAEWITPFAATGGVIITNSSPGSELNTGIRTGGAKVFSNGVPLTITSTGKMSTGGSALTFGGNAVNNGPKASVGSSTITINGTGAQSIGGFTTTGTVSMTKTNGTATFTSAMNGGALTINGSGGTLNLGVGLTHTFTGVVTLTAGTLNGGSSTLNENMVSTTAWNGTGTVFSAGTGTVNFGAAGNQTLSASATTFNNLTFSGSGAKTMTNVTTINGNFTLSGTATAAPSSGLTIGGTVTLGTGTTFTGGSLTHNVAGNWINNGATVTLTGTTINLNGSSAQAISGSTGTTFNNLTLNNSAGLTISNNETVNGTLLFTSGKITTGSYKIIIGSSGSVSGGSISSYVNGYLQKNVATGATSRTFEVGATYYDPVQVDFVNVTTAGDLTVGTKAGQHPNIGSSTLNSSKDVNVYWTLTNSGIVFDNCNATFNFESGDILGGANTDFFIVGRYSGGWTYPSVGSKTTTSTQATGITSFGAFVVGEPIEFISFTVTGTGINFGSLDPGMKDKPADQTPAVTLTVSANVPVKVQLKGDNFTSPSGIIDISNVKYNSSNTTSGASIMGKDYATWYTVPAYTNNTTECYDWISIPAGQRSDNYTSTFYYQAIKSP